MDKFELYFGAKYLLMSIFEKIMRDTVSVPADYYIHGGNKQFMYLDKSKLREVSNFIKLQLNDGNDITNIKRDKMLSVLWSDDIDIVVNPIHENTIMAAFYTLNDDNSLFKLQCKFLSRMICTFMGWDKNKDYKFKIDTRLVGPLKCNSINCKLVFDDEEITLCDCTFEKNYIFAGQLKDVIVHDNNMVLNQFKQNNFVSKADKRLCRMLFFISMIVNGYVNPIMCNSDINDFKNNGSKLKDNIIDQITYIKNYIEKRGSIFTGQGQKNEVRGFLNDEYFVIKINDDVSKPMNITLSNFDDIIVPNEEQLIRNLQNLCYYVQDAADRRTNFNFLQSLDHKNDLAHVENYVGDDLTRIRKYTDAESNDLQNYRPLNEYMIQSIYDMLSPFSQKNRTELSSNCSKLAEIAYNKDHISKSTTDRTDIIKVYRCENNINVNNHGGFHILNVGDKILTPTMWSTTEKLENIISENICKTKSILLEIELPKDANVIYVMSSSTFAKEKEILLPFGIYLEITDTYDVFYGKTYLFVKAKYIGSIAEIPEIRGLIDTKKEFTREYIEIYKTYIENPTKSLKDMYGISKIKSAEIIPEMFEAQNIINELKIQEMAFDKSTLRLKSFEKECNDANCTFDNISDLLFGHTIIVFKNTKSDLTIDCICSSVKQIDNISQCNAIIINNFTGDINECVSIISKNYGYENYEILQDSNKYYMIFTKENLIHCTMYNCMIDILIGFNQQFLHVYDIYKLNDKVCKKFIDTNYAKGEDLGAKNYNVNYVAIGYLYAQWEIIKNLNVLKSVEYNVGNELYLIYSEHKTAAVIPVEIIDKYDRSMRTSYNKYMLDKLMKKRITYDFGLLFTLNAHASIEKNIYIIPSFSDVPNSDKIICFVLSPSEINASNPLFMSIVKNIKQQIAKSNLKINIDIKAPYFGKINDTISSEFSDIPGATLIYKN